MRLIWGFVIRLIHLWSANGQSYNPRLLSERDRQTPVLPQSFSSSSAQAFSKTQNIISVQQSTLSERRRTLNASSVSPSALHQLFQGFQGSAPKSEGVQENFEEASRVLGNEHNLSPEQITFGLADTNLRTILPGNENQKFESQFTFSCNRTSRYRTFDGACNNLQNPSWGKTAACFERLVDPDYADGIAAKRVSVSGNSLPPPRTISLEIHKHLNIPTDFVTHMFMVYGQFLDHDISLTPLSPGPNNQALECCPVNENDPPQCDPIILGEDDPFFSSLGIDCLNNVRSAICPTCAFGPRQQINQVTSYIDASHIYGLNQNISAALRNNDGSGTMRFTSSRKGGELLPPSNDPKNDFCSFQDPNLDCFQTGDQRSNQHPALTSMHTLFLREHNRIARSLKILNRHWDGERIFQESRRIVAAIMQMITYKEFLPIAIGPERMKYFHLNIRHNGYTQYNDSVQATLFNEFSTAAYRFGHSMINSYFPQYSRQPNSGDRLKNLFQWPFGLYKGELEGFISGTTQSSSQKFDRHIVRDVTNHLYQLRGSASGLDLASLNVNRGRDHGVPGYTTLVEYCGGPRITSWEQLDDLFQPDYRPLFQRLYKDVRDIDLFSGGLAELPNEGAVIGPTFTCIIGVQFHNLKYGDRFYFEHGGQAGSFTKAQLREIRKISLGKLICQNSNIDRIQRSVMLFKNKRNILEDCEDLPELDLEAWIDKQ